MNSEFEKSFEKPLSHKFERKLEVWSYDIPNVSIYDFLINNKDLCGLQEVDDYWKDKKLRDFCFEAVQLQKNSERDNYNNDEIFSKEAKDRRVNEKIDKNKTKELYGVLKKYTDSRKADFRKKEENSEENREILKKEQEEILCYARVKEALDDMELKEYGEDAQKKKIRDGKKARELIDLAKNKKDDAVL